MDAAAQECFSRVLTLAAEDECYQKLQLYIEMLDEPFLAALKKLSDVDRSIVKEYVRVTGVSALRLTEIACELRNLPPTE